LDLLQGDADEVVLRSDDPRVALAMAGVPERIASLDELGVLRYESLELGDAVLSSIASEWWLATTTPEFADAAVQREVRAQIEACIAVYIATLDAIRESGASEGVAFNGRLGIMRAFIRACESAGIDYWTHERGADRTRFLRVRNGMRHQMSFISADIQRVAGTIPLPERSASRLLVLQGGSGALQDALFTDLAKHPACADFMASKLCRHFVTDTPPAALVQAVAAQFRRTDGDLKAVAVALFSHDLAWQENLPPKFKRPEECLISAHRLMQMKVINVENSAYWVQTMGQALALAPSPQGWPDLSADWLSPDAVIKRIQWAERYGELYGKDIDARDLMQQAFGPNLSTSTTQTIARAESGAQALARRRGPCPVTPQRLITGPASVAWWGYRSRSFACGEPAIDRGMSGVGHATTARSRLVERRSAQVFLGRKWQKWLVVCATTIRIGVRLPSVLPWSSGAGVSIGSSTFGWRACSVIWRRADVPGCGISPLSCGSFNAAKTSGRTTRYSPMTNCGWLP
jgi:hypothetical protein